MNEPCEIKVTRINKWYHIRLYSVGRLIDEVAVNERRDIGYACREVLRWYDKMGYQPPSLMADASRHRGKNHALIGKIRRVHV